MVEVFLLFFVGYCLGVVVVNVDCWNCFDCEWDDCLGDFCGWGFC